jgi:hypothetical protein
MNTTMQLVIEKEDYEQAKASDSGGCLIAHAIKRQYPRFSHVSVDTSFTRITDRERGEKYTYLTPPSAAEFLLAFDQGWEERDLPKKIRYRDRAIRVVPITRSASAVRQTAEQSAARLAMLEAKVQKGESLTGHERRSLTRLRNPKPRAQRPITGGPIQVEGEYGEEIIRGGTAPRHERYARLNANLLRGRDRLFGRKSAQPSEVFKQAVQEAVKADRAKRRKSKNQ